MPNFDAGSYFLTTFAPIKAGAAEGPDGCVSHIQRIRLTLATLPTAQQTPATARGGQQSPFARSMRTHLCRFVVIDDAVFNGRASGNPILARITGDDPIQPGPVDQLNCAYLMFAAEVDAVTEDGAPLPATLTREQQDAVRDAYARDLWAKMEPELRAIYENCTGFDRVQDADGFARYLARCQVETTMPFHDYWISPPALKPIPLRPLLLAVAAPLLALALAVLGWLIGAERTPVLSLLGDWPPGQALSWAAPASVLVLWAAYAFVMRRGAQPLPPPEGANLPGVLKALYLQQRYADFAIDQQGADPAALHAAFGRFLAEHRPDDLTAPSQPPGVTRWPPPARAPVPEMAARSGPQPEMAMAAAMAASDPDPAADVQTDQPQTAPAMLTRSSGARPREERRRVEAPPESPGPESRAPESRVSESRGPESRGPESRPAESRASDNPPQDNRPPDNRSPDTRPPGGRPPSGRRPRRKPES